MLIDFVGYSADCLLSGKVDLTAPSLADMLNDTPVVQLTNVVLEDLADALRITAGTYTLHRDDIYAVRQAGPSGSCVRRAGTVRRRLQAQIGPYNVLGRLNGMPGPMPMSGPELRGPMLPLSDATIAYVVGGILEVRDVSLMLINRDLLSWVRAADEELEREETGMALGRMYAVSG